MNIVLVGLMGSGKSAVGRALAEALDRPFLDTDAQIEGRTGRSIPAIFAAEGEVAFRDLESAAIHEAAAADGLVIATGGGAVLRASNREALRQSGVVFWLDAPPEELCRRALEQGVQSRPLLAGEDPLGKLRDLAESRASAYRAAAHYQVDTAGKSPAAVAAEILEILKEKR